MTPVERFHHVRKEMDRILRRFLLLSALIFVVMMLFIFVCSNENGTIENKPAVAIVVGVLIAQISNAVVAYFAVDRI